MTQDAPHMSNTNTSRYDGMAIVDAQVHAWAQGQSTGHHRRDPITGDILAAEMADAGVQRAVLVPPLWDTHGNAYSLQLAQAQPDRFAVMGVISAASAEAINPARHLPDWSKQQGMRGARFLFNTPERAVPLLEGRFDALWPVAEELGLVCALLVPSQLKHVDAIATRYPELTVIVDHLGVPRGATGPSAFDHLPQLLALARHPRIYVKAAGVGDYALDPYPFHSLDGVLHRVFDAFGPDRLIWASDLSRLHHPYRECVSHFCETLCWMSSTDLKKVMGGNISRLLKWS